MTSLEQIAPAFIDMAHSIVWASVATVDANGRPRTRILHPFWEWDGTDPLGWIATVPSPVKKNHLAVHPEVSVSYWTTNHDTCSAECLVEWYVDDETRAAVGEVRHRPCTGGLRPSDHPDVAGRADLRAVRRAAVGAVPHPGHARDGDDER